MIGFIKWGFVHDNQLIAIFFYVATLLLGVSWFSAMAEMFSRGYGWYSLALLFAPFLAALPKLWNMYAREKAK